MCGRVAGGRDYHVIEEEVAVAGERTTLRCCRDDTDAKEEEEERDFLRHSFPPRSSVCP